MIGMPNGWLCDRGESGSEQKAKITQGVSEAVVISSSGDGAAFRQV